MSRLSVGSSSEVNSLVNFEAEENTRGKIKELDETTEKPDIGETVDQSYNSQKDLVTQSGDVSRNIHQLCVIITEAAEENDHVDNAVVDAQVNKSRSNNKKQKEKIHISTGEWRIIMSAINHGMEVPANSRREALMGYQYALHQHKKRLREIMLGEAKKTTVCQVEKDTRIQSIIGGQQHGQGKRTMQGA
jgi:hypothetical protein